MRKILISFDLRYKSELRNLLLVMVLIDTGVRNSKFIKIKLEDINFVDRSIYIYATKTNTFRMVYYSKETKKLLSVYHREVLKGAGKGPQEVCGKAVILFIYSFILVLSFFLKTAKQKGKRFCRSSSKYDIINI